MQLVDTGRNDPCPCGTGRKYKKCCLAARDKVLAGNASDINGAVIVDEAIETDNWEAIHDLVDRAMEVFEVGAPLEHVRFRDDLIGVRDPDGIDPVKRCPPGWLARCELEIAHVLARFELESQVRDALRMAAHLVRRFGARSPIVEELARLQIGECVDRRRRFANAMSARELTLPDLEIAWSDIASWIERVRPSILSFAEWFALRAAPDTLLETIWMSGIATSISEVCIERIEDEPLEDAPSWAALAGLVSADNMAPMGRFLARETTLQNLSADEQTVYDSLHHRRQQHGRNGVLHDILRATEVRGDYAGAALIRETMRLVQNRRR